tara:strand:+ start:1112 stop:1534 length:423 start_codon:yes stop_codon:yes gene_type:complete
MTLLSLAKVLLKIKSALKKAWLWIKSHGDIVAIIAVAIILGTAGKKINLSKVIQSKKENYKKQIDAIESSHKEEIEKRESALRRYHSVIADIENQHRDEKDKLDSKKKKLIKSIIEENKDNPDEITRRIADATGFSVHVE